MSRSQPRGVIREAAAAAGMNGVSPVSIPGALGRLRDLRNQTVTAAPTMAPGLNRT